MPAATDLLVGMGAGDHLIAISNWDTSRAEIRGLPRVGDYQTIDWEQLAELRPQIMIIFMSGPRMPSGIQQRADDLGIRLVNVRIETLENLFAAIDQLGELAREPMKARELSQRIHGQLDAVAQRVSGQPTVPTLLTVNAQGTALIGGNTFADDLLKIAGGTNVAGGFELRYPTVDRERLIELAPQAIVQLLPDASPQLLDQAKQTWQQMPELPAVKDGRVYVLTDWYVLQPGSHVGELAGKLAERLHPQ